MAANQFDSPPDVRRTGDAGGHSASFGHATSRRPPDRASTLIAAGSADHRRAKWRHARVEFPDRPRVRRMSLSEHPVKRRRLLATAALSAGAAALSDGLVPARSGAAVPAQVTPPARGIYDTAAATAWTDGFLTGNGEYGAVLHGTPTLEKVIFNHHRFVLPNGSRGVLPPVNSGQLSRARDQAMAGDYGG